MEDYLQCESRLVDPDLKKPLSVALAYPDRYENGLPNLGVQTLYRLIRAEHARGIFTSTNTTESVAPQEL